MPGRVALRAGRYRMRGDFLHTEADARCLYDDTVFFHAKCLSLLTERPMRMRTPWRRRTLGRRQMERRTDERELTDGERWRPSGLTERPAR